MDNKGNRLKALLGGKERVSDTLKEKPQPVVIKDEVKEQEAAIREDNELNGKINKSLKHQTFLLDINEFNQFRLKLMEFNIKNSPNKISQSELIRMFISYANRAGINETIKKFNYEYK